MRILMINDYKDKIGGAEMHIYNLMDELKRHGHQVDFFYSNASASDYNKNLKYKGLLKLVSNTFNYRYYLRLKEYLKKSKPDVVHIHGIFNELSPSILLSLRKYPVIMTAHNLQMISPFPKPFYTFWKTCQNKKCNKCVRCISLKSIIYEFIKNKIHRTMLKHVSYYICPSDYMKKQLDLDGFNNTIRIHNGIKLLKPFPINNFKNILYVGRFTNDKGLRYLIKAMPKIVNIFPKVTLTVVGDGQERKAIEEIIKKLHLEKNVKLKGWMSEEELKHEYKNCTVVVIPSIWQEPFGLVGIEAMSAGRPIIGSKVGGIPEWLINDITGYLVEPKNSLQISERIIKILSNKNLLKKLGKNAKNNAKKFNIDKYINQVEKIYANSLLKYN